MNGREKESIDHIKNIMERSTTFISLSGISGVISGIIGILTTYLLYLELGTHVMSHDTYFLVYSGKASVLKIIIILLCSFIFSISVSLFLSYKNSRKYSTQIYNSSSKNFAVSLFLPLITAGILIIALWQSMSLFLVLPVMVLFYGLAMINASKYSREEVFHFGVVAVIFGLIAAFVPKLGLLIWGVVFGLLNIFYGIKMYYRYERNNSSNK